MSARVLVGDCRDVLATLEPECIDAVVTDPPYGLAFMGKGWDHSVPGVDFWAAALRVAKPGAHLVAFGGTRTFHRLTCAIEDAGWEIRDCLSWLYGSGFPKSLDVSKAIDKAAGAEREVVGFDPSEYRPNRDKYLLDGQPGGGGRLKADNGATSTAPATDAAREWSGWGTTLKPAWEPIILARKPLGGTVAANVLEHGTGALNIDGCRIGFASADDERESKEKNRHADFGTGARDNKVYGVDTRARGENGNYDAPGRWPANVALDEEAARLLDEQSGGASRFFYTAKAGRAERNAGLDDRDERPLNWSSGDANPGAFQSPNTHRAARNHHPTVKPLDLMQWLCRLMTPKGGLILDPFCGSGTTGRAAVAEGFRFVGIELEPEYAELARARIRDYAPLFAEEA